MGLCIIMLGGRIALLLNNQKNILDGQVPKKRRPLVLISQENNLVHLVLSYLTTWTITHRLLA